MYFSLQMNSEFLFLFDVDPLLALFICFCFVGVLDLLDRVFEFDKEDIFESIILCVSKFQSIAAQNCKFAEILFSHIS